ncbi:MAG: hypothetical protein EPN91_07250 [Salinibacterium sp.]|nr:MAG: hypothetical protein EPN91_07250 [Salinibacterium sp.]
MTTGSPPDDLSYSLKVVLGPDDENYGTGCSFCGDKTHAVCANVELAEETERFAEGQVSLARICGACAGRVGPALMNDSLARMRAELKG